MNVITGGIIKCDIQPAIVIAKGVRGSLTWPIQEHRQTAVVRKIPVEIPIKITGDFQAQSDRRDMRDIRRDSVDIRYAIGIAVGNGLVDLLKKVSLR